MKNGARHRILLMVFGVLLLFAMWRYSRPVEPTARMASTRSAGAVRSVVHPRVRVAMLQASDLDGARHASVPGRDPWRFVDIPARPHAPEPMNVASPLPSALPSSPPLPAAKPPAFTLEYLGHFGPRHKKIAVFSDGRRVVNALEGDAIDGHFIVARIGYESVEIRLADFPGWPAQRLGVMARKLR